MFAVDETSGARNLLQHRTVVAAGPRRTSLEAATSGVWNSVQYGGYRPGYPVAAAFLTLLGACTGRYGPSPDAALVASRRPYAQDIPLPAGFRLADQSSEDWSGGSVRYLRHRYRGRADRFSVRKFYRDQMPLVRWTLVSDGNVPGRCTMRFERGAESCTVVIEQDAPRRLRGVRVDVTITPKPAAR